MRHNLYTRAHVRIQAHTHTNTHDRIQTFTLSLLLPFGQIKTCVTTVSCSWADQYHCPINHVRGKQMQQWSSRTGCVRFSFSHLQLLLRVSHRHIICLWKMFLKDAINNQIHKNTPQQLEKKELLCFSLCSCICHLLVAVWFPDPDLSNTWRTCRFLTVSTGWISNLL